MKSPEIAMLDEAVREALFAAYCIGHSHADSWVGPPVESYQDLRPDFDIWLQAVGEPRHPPVERPEPIATNDLAMTLACLTYFAPSYEAAVNAFALAHQHACEILEDEGIKPSRDEMLAAVEEWTK